MRHTTLLRAVAILRNAPLAAACVLAFVLMLAAGGLSFADIESGPAPTFGPFTVLDAVGVTAEPVDRDSRRALKLSLAERGAVVTSLRAGGPAIRGGVRVGDVIERVDGGRVDGPKTLTHAVERSDASDLDLVVVRSGHREHLAIERPRLGA